MLLPGLLERQAAYYVLARPGTSRVGPAGAAVELGLTHMDATQRERHKRQCKRQRQRRLQEAEGPCAPWEPSPERLTALTVEEIVAVVEYRYGWLMSHQRVSAICRAAEAKLRQRLEGEV
jgi:hypothetical protein